MVGLRLGLGFMVMVRVRVSFMVTGQMVAVWSVTATRLCSAPIAAAPEFGGIGKMKESPRIMRHSNSHTGRLVKRNERSGIS